MNEKIMLNELPVLSGMEACFNGLISKIKCTENPSELNDETNKFFECVLNKFVEFFYFENAGETIKKLHCPNLGERMVKVMDFDYAWKQYMEYLNGMKTYVDNARNKDLNTEDIKKQIEDIILKDEDFIKSLFVYGENKNNPEKEMPLKDAINYLNIFFNVKNTAMNFKCDTYTSCPFDKLYLHSKVSVIYYASKGIAEQTRRIVDELNGDKKDCGTAIKYSVF